MNRTTTYTLESELCVPSPLTTVFEFFSNAQNLDALTPPWLHFRILTLPPIEMREGTLIDYRLRLHGLPIGWKTEITAWEPPYRFVDTQIKGPYHWWEHEHTFVEQADGTLVRDKVDYSARGGRLANWLFVRRDLERIFRYRHERLCELFCTVNEVITIR